MKIWISVTFVFVLLVMTVNALVIGNGEQGNFEGTFDALRIYDRAISEKDARQYYLSNLYKYDADKWSFFTNQTELDEGRYTYYGCGQDEAGNTNCTGIRTITICADIDYDGVCDKDDACIGESYSFKPDNLSCLGYIEFNFDTGCWNQDIKPKGTACDSEKWYSNYSCSIGYTDILQADYNLTCDGEGECDVLTKGADRAIDTCSATEKCQGPISSFNTEDFDCVCKQDTDKDGVCNGDDRCEGENATNFVERGHIDAPPCIEWIGFDTDTGCHINITYSGAKVINECPRDEDAKTGTWCYRENESIEVQKCNDAGALLPEGLTCSQKDQVCNGDPDLNIQTCAENLSVSTSALQCHNHKKQCYSELAPYYYSGIMGGNGGCCGDDGLNECWLDSNANACCYYKNASAVAYLTDPDDSMGYCLLLGYNKTKVSAGACDNGDTYCWDEVSQNCCGDEMNETWSYSTSRKIGDVLVNETCYNGRWTLISKKETTYFDLMSKILDMLG